MILKVILLKFHLKKIAKKHFQLKFDQDNHLIIQFLKNLLKIQSRRQNLNINNNT